MVRNQLACTCKRLPGPDALPILRELLHRDEDMADPQIPLLLWWAIESKAVSNREQVLAMLLDGDPWKVPLVRRFIIDRLGRRYAAEKSGTGYAVCARLLGGGARSRRNRQPARGNGKGVHRRTARAAPPELAGPLADLWKRDKRGLPLIRFALRVGSREAHARALELVAGRTASEGDRLAFIEAIGEAAQPESVPVLLGLIGGAESKRVQAAALAALEGFAQERIAVTLLEKYPRLDPDLRTRLRDLLCSRKAWAVALLKAVDDGRMPAKELAADQVQRIALHNDPALWDLLGRHWGTVRAATPKELHDRIVEVGNLLYVKADRHPANGRRLFTQHCAICHKLFGEGTALGPDLTGADRRNRDFLLTSVIDPSAAIRGEYVAQVVATTDGRTLIGLIADSTPQGVTLVDAKNQRTFVRRDRIESMTPSPVSLMPEKLLDNLNHDEIRDLFSYLQSDGPSGGPGPAPAPLKVCLVSGSLEYKSDASLDAFQKLLESRYAVKCTRAFRKADDDLPGLENLESCDVVLLFTRRLTIDGEQLARVKKYCQSGKPIVAVRTASHAFKNWLALDKEVLGGNYQGHYGVGPAMQVEIVPTARAHPILTGVQPFQTKASLYKNSGLAGDVEVLLNGTIPGHTEPIAWTRTHKGGRIFYTSLGAPDDFANESFRRVLVNALFWTARREPAAAGSGARK